MRVRRSVAVAYAVACAMLLLGGAGFRVAVDRLNIFVVKRPVELRGALDTIPPTLGRWSRVGEDSRFSAALVEELGTRQYLDRIYAIGGDPAAGIANLHIAYYTGAIDDVPHIPERCWDAAGMRMSRTPQRMPLAIDREAWEIEPERINRATGEPYRSIAVRHPVTGLQERVYMPIGEPEITVTEFQPPLQPDRRQMGGYFFIANGRWTASALGVRSLAFSLTDKHAYYCKVQVTVPDLAADGPEGLERFQSIASELVSELMPHLMKRLPQWPEYEQDAR